MPIDDVTEEELEAARRESKKAIDITENVQNQLNPIVTILKIALMQTFDILDDINPEWKAAIKLLDHLTTKAPIACIMGNKFFGTIDDGAFQRRAGNGHNAVIAIYDHPTFPDGNGHTYKDLAVVAGIETVLKLAATVFGRLLGRRGKIYEEFAKYPKVAFLVAIADMLDSHFIVDEDSVDKMVDLWHDDRHITGSDIRTWIKKNNDDVEQLNLDYQQLEPARPTITPREQCRVMVKNIDTSTNAVYDNIVDRILNDMTAGLITSRKLKQHQTALIHLAERKFPDTNSLASSASARKGAPRAKPPHLVYWRLSDLS